MTDIVPRLDTIEFDQLAELARGDIPRYAPDWTDHNLHDPGMTLIDLLAWVVDQQVFRAGFVGGRHRRAFAALLGQVSRGPTPARGLVWPGGRVRDGRFVRVGSDVVCLQHTDLGFALGWSDVPADPAPSLYLPPVARTGVTVTREGVELAVASAATDGGALGGGGIVADSAVTLRFDGPLGTTEAAWIALGVEVAPPPGPPLAPGDPHWGPVSYAYRVGAERWVELEVVHDGTAGLATTGAVILAVQPAGAGTGTAELRLAFDRGFFPVPPQIQAATVNVLPVVQRRWEAPASLGLGTGQPDQVVELDGADLLDPPELRVAGETWQQQRDLDRSGPDDPHYVLHPDHVLFGNGVNGRRPDRGADIRHTGLSGTAGKAGNLRPGLDWSLPALGPAAYGRNRQVLTGGTDRTTADDLAGAAREAAVTRAALLTDDELAAAARGLTGLAVGRAEVVARFDRRLGERRIDGVRTLVVVPHQPTWSGDGPPPDLVRPSQAYLDAVAARLAGRRVLGERLIVQGPVVVTVDVTMTVTVEAGAAVAEVEAAVRRAVHRRLAAVADGGTPWPLGRALTVVDLEVVAVTVPAVVRVASVRVGTAGGPLGTDPVPVPRDGLVVAADLRVDVRGGPTR